MKAYIFPGQGSQFPGMGKELYESNSDAKNLFDAANRILGFDLVDVMFNGSADDLKQTRVTQPAIFLYSVALIPSLKNFNPSMVAGHSLGEFSALVAAECLSFEDALKLVSIRAQAMQKACEMNPSTMAAVLRLEDDVVEDVCNGIDEVVVPANYNCPGQLVISGSFKGIEMAKEALMEKGARRVLELPVGGAFHSPLMEPAREELAEAINQTQFASPKCPIYQNAVAKGISEASEIKQNLIAQLTAPVKWSQSIKAMISDGATEFIEVGPGKVLQGLVAKINDEVEVTGVN